VDQTGCYVILVITKFDECVDVHGELLGVKVAQEK